jgi:transcriptional regulator GlxA family with amidase domain
VVSVCTGSFLLAEAGLLDGRRAATHWAYAQAFSARYPQVKLDSDAIFVNDGKYYCSAGVTAGMDLALHLIEQDHGPALALDVARRWLLYAKRPGGQSQFSTMLPPRAASRDSLTTLCNWLPAHLDADLSVAALAARMAMSPRHFARVFYTEFGVTPARFVEGLRVEAARRWLERGEHNVDTIAQACGLGASERMRRAFLRRLGVNPRDYRSRFETAISVSPNKRREL